jgi:hypothetical protein
MFRLPLPLIIDPSAMSAVFIGSLVSGTLRNSCGPLARLFARGCGYATMCLWHLCSFRVWVYVLHTSLLRGCALVIPWCPRCLGTRVERRLRSYASALHMFHLWWIHFGYAAVSAVSRHSCRAQIVESDVRRGCLGAL